MDIQIAPTPATYLPQAMRVPVFDRHVRRKQFTSCDACRRLRRSCDAFNRGATPLQPQNTTTDFRGCSACVKAGRRCTFEWLKDVPETTLPRRLKRRNVPASRDNDNTRETNPVREPSNNGMYTSIPRPTLDTTPTDATLYQELQQPVDWDAIAFQQENYMNDLWADTFTHNLWFHDVPQAQSCSKPCTNTPRSGKMPSNTSHANLAALPSNSGGMTLSSATPPQSYTFEPEVMPAQRTTQPDIDLDWFDPTDEELPQTFNPSDSFSQENSSDAFGEIPKTTSASPTLDDHIVQVTNKRLISTELVQIYHTSMESSMVCFLSEYNCPYSSGKVSLLYCRRNGKNFYQYKPPTYLQRIHQLEQASEPLRGKKLTSGQKIVAAKALQLAIMAFACQWTHASVWPPRSPNASFSDAMIDEIGTSYGFERLLQQSLWHEAQRYVETTAYIDSFRSIFAQILFSMVQQPSFLNDLEKEALESPAPSPISVAMRFGDPATESDSPFSRQTPKVKPEERMFRHKYLAQALRHLAQWKKRLSRWKNSSELSAAAETKDPALQRAAKEMDGSFHLLWWFGVMCDTSVSVINDKPLVIPDHEVHTYKAPQSARIENAPPPEIQPGQQRADERRSDSHAASKLHIWDVDLMPAQPFQALISDAESVIREACPSKVLMWRKLGSLKAIIDQPVDQDLTERHIRSTLQVYEFWRNTYGDFIQECIRNHHTLSFQVQSWYVILGCHFHLASLFIADCIKEIDHRRQSSTKGRFLRAASALTLEITKTGVNVISEIAAVSL
ncbi:uncharacterized protein PV07_05092 [Cladophialophora immunda]|uniref:Zn(2)-C6 fungal-type domain-containing protein n=1 Tax=Cladophialophora immunda TaxID=569365 RepID=A0A0D2AVG4_9EURO|nr:uncharacterized protein PV07_05092 [Cladophialophora immunda]KIW29267.1 hypothetical protein PV07_05092 [Cladophialophora immunda]